MNQKAIDRLFDRLAATYGAAWDRSLGATPLVDAKSIWAHELQGFAQRLEAVVWALDQLPEHPPNVIQFRNLCRQAPAPEVPLLPEAKADPTQLAAELAKLGDLRATVIAQPAGDMKAWARRLKAREMAAERLSSFQRNAWRVALGEAA
jgi:hypothetical protein